MQVPQDITLGLLWPKFSGVRFYLHFNLIFTIAPTLTLEVPLLLAALLNVLERGLNEIPVHIC